MRPSVPVRTAVSDLHEALGAAGGVLSVAESCTGGLLSGAITAEPGASAVFDRGVVTYSNAAKRDLLDVPAITLSRAGAVSGPTARAMATGACTLADAEWGLSVTGIAGPDGGRPGKPVGTVYVGIAHDDGETVRSRARQYRFDGDRDAIRTQTVRTAIERAAAVVRRRSAQVSNRPP
ncbi:MAG: CinA family protein [Halobacteriales archaeon]